MRIAFYAPLKSPDHPVPSGDRRMARLFVEALRRAGHEVALASRFRSYDGAGDAVRQARLCRLGARLAVRYADRSRSHPPDLWFSYHLYHKAPDWLGPAIARRLDIPYIVAEASFAPKQQGGPWTAGHEAVAHAVRNADCVISVNPDDTECLRPLLADNRRLLAMKPFLDAAPPARARAGRAEHRLALAARFGIDPDDPWITVIAMMRPGDKLASYRLLGDALRRIADRRWTLLVAGDGPARADVAAELNFGDRVRFLGVLEGEAIDRLNAAADLGAWPAINEAYGMALLEAQAAGLPLVVGDRAGVRQIVEEGDTALLVPPGDATAFAAALASLLDVPARRAGMATAAVEHVRREHDLPFAVRQLDAAVVSAAAGRLQAVRP
ncbi:MAG: glycosyltransferase family 4 protein [Alphaproteobacteria bacterium]|nr:glycosyltransferase family 4 protein [Alphaproteobacteria bacterium]